ncbi:MAG: MFS transporter [Methanomassiliicoccales archaeon]|jgi:EmrB/QacA subfamily drug resistance transporter
MAPEAQETTAAIGVEPTKTRRMSYATVVLLTSTMAVLLINYVETMVLPGIPDIQKELNTSAALASWITSAFLVVGAAVAPLFGKLGDVYGKKKMFLIVLGFYIVGVGLAGLSNNIYMLLVARAIQGIGFATLPLAIAMVTDVFPKGRVAAAQGVISGTVAIGTTLGLVLGAYVVQGLGWHYAFYTALILSILLFIVAFIVLKKDTPGCRTKMDYAGSAILMAGITLVLIYITEGPTRGWLSLDNLAFLIPGVILSVYFFVFESKRKSPLIEMKLLKIRNVLIANLVGIISGAGLFLAFFGVVYYAELPTAAGGLGLDDISTGLALAPASIVMMVVGPLIGRVMPKVGPRPVIILGSLVMMAGFAMFAFMRGSVVEISLDATVAFVGTVMVMIPMVNMISTALPCESMTVGLGVNSMLRNLGGAIGPVLATTIMSTFVITVFTVTVPSATAFSVIFGVGIVFSLATLLISLAIRNYVFKDGVCVEKGSRDRNLP